ncbi:MAG: type IV secretion system protein [Silvibacterium sp.]|nr:type IV secretion system protein [Silvibacterium sp.]
MTNATDTNALDTRTRRAKREFEEIWSNLVAGKRNWMYMAFLEGLVLAGMAWGMWRLGSMRKEVLYVLERGKQNEVAYFGPVKPVDMDAATWDLVKVESLKKFVSYWRTVTADRSAAANNWDRAFMYVGDGSQAKKALAKWYEQNDPIKRGANGEIVSVEYKTFDVEGQHTYGIWWQETATSLSGQVTSQKTWRARITYAVHIPTSEKAREENSLGILATELSWEPVE